MVLIYQGSGAEVMYPNLFKELGLKNEDLSKYNTPLVKFDGPMMIPEGQISLPMNMEGMEVMVSGRFVFFVYDNPRKALDSCNGDNPVHPACEGQIPHQARYCYSEGKPASGQAILSGHS